MPRHAGRHPVECGDQPVDDQSVADLHDLGQVRHELHNRAAVVSGFAALIADEVGEVTIDIVRGHLARLAENTLQMDALLADWSTRLGGDGVSDGAVSATPSAWLAELPGGVEPQLLVVEDDDDHFHLFQSLLGPAIGAGWQVVRCHSLRDACHQLTVSRPACALLDLSLPDAVALEALAALHTIDPELPIIVTTGYAEAARGVDAVRHGAQDYLVKGGITRELLERTIVYAVERARLEAQRSHDALHDSLTGLANRKLLQDRLALACARLGRHHARLAVLFVDLDRFKFINDTLGHRVGDELLMGVAERFQHVVRRADTVARIGGDEFVLLFEDIDDAGEAARLAEHVLEMFATPFEYAGGHQSMSASIGVALSDGPSTSPEELLANADTAMYRAKEEGRSRWELFDQQMRLRLVDRFETERHLSRAVSAGELELHYQPIVELRTGRILGVEALMRWRHPQRGLLMPTDFLPVAEDSGQIVELGAWAVAEACDQARRWQAVSALPRGFVMWVNASSRQFESAELFKGVERALGTTHDGWDLGLEITESALIRDLERAVALLSPLHARGVRLAVDDFGTGFSSLSWLRTLPIDHLKVDQSFVSGVGVEPADSAIVSACLGLGRGLGVGCVAEGIETPQQLAALRAMGCETGQGYLFARPTTGAGMERLLHSGRLALSGIPRQVGAASRKLAGRLE
ncbi:MAG TPA: EAL domain-containing protein [Mycobacteriales bacterium]|nr:EAL domain-containing protein [Mycobacteriales bacterium]